MNITVLWYVMPCSLETRYNKSGKPHAHPSSEWTVSQARALRLLLFQSELRSRPFRSIYRYHFIFCWLRILVNNQLDALFQCIYLFHFSTCFEQPSAHHQENQLYQYIIWHVSLCVRYAGPEGTPDRHTRQSLTQNDTYQMMYWYNWFSWWWALGCSKHVEKWIKWIHWKSASSWLLTRTMSISFVCFSMLGSSGWNIVINVSKGTVAVLVKTGRRMQGPGQNSFLGSQWSGSIQLGILGCLLKHSWPDRHEWLRSQIWQLGPVHNRESDLPNLNGVLPYRQTAVHWRTIHAPVWRSAAHTYVRKGYVAGSKCLRTAIKATCYVRNTHIHGELKLPIFASYIRALTRGFRLKAGAGRPQIGNVTDTSDDQGLIEVTGGTRTNAAARNKAAKVDITSFAQHFLATPTTGPGAHRASYTMGNGSLSWGLKRPGRGLDHPPLTSKLKKQ
jgi:hypothetical protein